MSDEDTGRPKAPVAAAARQASQFSKDFLATVISLVTTALGVVVALAWNSALTGLFAEWFQDHPAAKVTALFVYALAITGIGVVAIIFLARLAARIGAEPIEFKYPAKGKDEK